MEGEVEQYLQAIWSTTTWSQMRSLWTRLTSFATINDMPVDDHTAVMFVHAMQVTVQTKHTYARHLINVFRKLGVQHQELTLMDTALRANGALMPLHQARPMTKTDMITICRQSDNTTRYLLLLAWKTASRWDEVQRLQPRSLLSVEDNEIVVYFGAETKTTRTRPFRPDLFVVIRGDGTAAMAAFLRTARLGKRMEEPLFNYPTPRIREVLLPYGYSAHSIKRGAILHVLQVLPEESPLLSIVPLLGKHAPHFPVLGDLTVRYSAEQVTVARHLGTGSLTALL
ncbi:hypothetical protein NESM_000864200 [Novymonas esmeraldas]|uniref:Integrase n=1 Tax=Novymonas esmeraldas TaxID=1808958 RepID=A0AAW0EXV7_9TRYP